MLQFRQWPENKRPTITMPPNLQEVKLEFARRRSAKVIGSLAYQSQMPESGKTQLNIPQEGDAIQGILVTQNQSSKIVSPDDLATYTPLRVGSVSSTLHVPFVTATTSDGKSVYVDNFRFLLNEMFSGVVESTFPLSSYRVEDVNQTVPVGVVEVEQEDDIDENDSSREVTTQGSAGSSRAAFRVVVFSLLDNDVRSSQYYLHLTYLNRIVANNIFILFLHDRLRYRLERQWESQQLNGMRVH